MGTRAITVIKDSAGEKVAEIYRQYDGYMEDGHGDDLVGILENTKHNGANCLAASVVAGLKDGVGNIYLLPPTDLEDVQQYANEYGVEFVYEIYVGDGVKSNTYCVHLEVFEPVIEDGKKSIFEAKFYQ